MLRIRITGTESELRKVVHKTGTTRIKRLKRQNGQITYAIDVGISIDDFLDKIDLSADNDSADTDNIQTMSPDESDKETCNPQVIQAELEELLEEITDK